MPLPPALAARLAKRGLVDESVVKASQEKVQRVETEEEVIAENYDTSLHRRTRVTTGATANGNEEISSVQIEKHFKGHPGCPNKWNVFHECNNFCISHWGMGITTPSPKYLRKQAKLMVKYPLPNTWKEVYDPGTGIHYYWEVTSDMVSWLPPGHPKALVTEAAATLREERHLVATDADGSDRESDSQEEEEEEDLEEMLPATDEREKEERRKATEERRRTEERRKPDGRTKVKTNDLDPMDPAAYSNAPRGRWSDGLERGNEAKTGADVTASGPLYQMRPYPNPGAVLRANAASKHQKES